MALSLATRAVRAHCPLQAHLLEIVSGPWPPGNRAWQSRRPVGGRGGPERHLLRLRPQLWNADYARNVPFAPFRNGLLFRLLRRRVFAGILIRPDVKAQVHVAPHVRVIPSGRRIQQFPPAAGESTVFGKRSRSDSLGVSLCRILLLRAPNRPQEVHIALLVIPWAASQVPSALLNRSVRRVGAP